MSEYEKLHARIAQLVERNSRLGAGLECALGDLATAKGIIERNQKDADRYRWLRDGVHAENIEANDGSAYAGTYNCEFRSYQGEALDKLIDTDMQKATI